VGRKGNSTLLKAPDGRVVEYPDPVDYNSLNTILLEQ
jgi:hypothetical protein